MFGFESDEKLQTRLICLFMLLCNCQQELIIVAAVALAFAEFGSSVHFSYALALVTAFTPMPKRERLPPHQNWNSNVFFV